MWWARLDDLTEAHLGVLDKHERERLARLRRPEDQARFALGSVVVRSLVAELADTRAELVRVDRTCPRCGAQHGPVTLPDLAWHCSVSHSGSFALVAAVAHEDSAMVGVDLETRVPPDWPRLLPRVLAPGEPEPADAREFLALWVRKESVLKATREGLSRPMSSVRLTGAVDPRGAVDGAPPLQLTDLDPTPLGASGEVAGAVAVAGDGLAVTWERARI